MRLSTRNQLTGTVASICHPPARWDQGFAMT
jgi:molybdopterin-binding protein